MFKIYVPEEKVTKPHDPLEAGLLLFKNIFMTKLVLELQLLESLCFLLDISKAERDWICNFKLPSVNTEFTEERRYLQCY